MFIPRLSRQSELKPSPTSRSTTMYEEKCNAWFFKNKRGDNNNHHGASIRYPRSTPSSPPLSCGKRAQKKSMRPRPKHAHAHETDLLYRVGHHHLVSARVTIKRTNKKQTEGTETNNETSTAAANMIYDTASSFPVFHRPRPRPLHALTPSPPPQNPPSQPL